MIDYLQKKKGRKTMLEVLNRINELAKKQKEEGLTKAELNERMKIPRFFVT
ncbi:DUF896 domain-containing protein [Bacillus sp. 3G2]|uniref:DUF896 domain-containing protein n=1 Tax=Bacillus sp. 3G2 TaxID=3375707 RepID=UPI003786FA17